MLRQMTGLPLLLSLLGIFPASQAAEELAFEVQVSKREFQTGEPIVVTVSITNRGDKPVEEVWTSIGFKQELWPTLYSGERPLRYKIDSLGSSLGVELHEKSALPPKKEWHGEFVLPQRHTLRFSFPLNYPYEPFHGACVNMSYPDTVHVPGELRGTLGPGAYQLGTKLSLLRRRAAIEDNLYREFMKENGIERGTPVSDEQVRAFNQLFKRHLAQAEAAGVRVEYTASTDFKVVENDKSNADLRGILEAAILACENRRAPDFATALPKLKDLAEKGKGTVWEPWAHYGLGRTYLLKKDAKEALASFEHVRELAGSEGYLAGSVLVQQRKCHELLGEAGKQRKEEVEKALKEKFGCIGVFGEGVIELKPARPGTK